MIQGASTFTSSFVAPDSAAVETNVPGLVRIFGDEEGEQKMFKPQSGGTI